MTISLIGHLIKKSKYTRPEICKLLGISQNTLSNWCQGNTYPSVIQGIKLAKLLGCKVEDMYLLDDE